MSKEASLNTQLRREDITYLVFIDVVYLNGIKFTTWNMAQIAREKVI